MNVHVLVNLHLIFQIFFETPIGKKLEKKTLFLGEDDFTRR